MMALRRLSRLVLPFTVMTIVGCGGGDDSTGPQGDNDSGTSSDGAVVKDGASTADSGSRDGSSHDSTAPDTGTIETDSSVPDSSVDATSNADGGTDANGPDAKADTGTVVDAGTDAKTDSGTVVDAASDTGTTVVDAGTDSGIADSGSDSGVVSTYKIGGTVSGLAGSGLVLQDNAGDDLPVSTNGTFTFAKSIASGAAYAVTVKTQPSGPSQTCAVTSGSGTVGSANVGSVSITCTTNSFTVGGTVSGLAANATLVLQDNGGDDVSLTANGPFTFATSVASGGNYSVTVKTQPSAPSQVCTVTSGSGAVGASNVSVSVSCVTTAFTIGGTVAGLDVGQSVTLQDNGGDDLVVNANGGFTFATSVTSGGAYAVTVTSSPGDRVCTVTNGSGTVGASNVTNVSVSCSAMVCSEIGEGGTISLACPSGLLVQSIDFASYGTPNGACGSYTVDNNCDATSSTSIVSATCDGQASCSVGANNSVFGDPCYGTYKHMYVQATCAP